MEAMFLTVKEKICGKGVCQSKPCGVRLELKADM